MTRLGVCSNAFSAFQSLVPFGFVLGLHCSEGGLRLHQQDFKYQFAFYSLRYAGAVYPLCAQLKPCVVWLFIENQEIPLSTSFLLGVPKFLLPTGFLYTFSSGQRNGVSLGILVICAIALQYICMTACLGSKPCEKGGERALHIFFGPQGFLFPVFLSGKSGFSQSFDCQCRQFTVQFSDLDPPLAKATVERNEKTSKKNDKHPHVDCVFIFLLFHDPLAFCSLLPSHFSKSLASCFCICLEFLVIIS